MTKLSRYILFFLLVFSPLTSAEELRYEVWPGLTIAIPSDWQIQATDEITEILDNAGHLIRKIGREPRASLDQAKIPLRASSPPGDNRYLLNVMIGPPEVSQDEFLQLPPDIISQIGGQLTHIAVTTLEAQNAGDISVSNLSLESIGGLPALKMSIGYSGGGWQFREEKYYIYTRYFTAIMTFQAASKVMSPKVADMYSIISSVSFNILNP